MAYTFDSSSIRTTDMREFLRQLEVETLVLGLVPDEGGLGGFARSSNIRVGVGGAGSE